MIAPVHRLKKVDIIWLSRNRCSHGHTFLEHYNCYLKELPDEQEKIGFFDIETTDLRADWGIMLTYCIKERGSKHIYSGSIKKKAAQQDDKEDKALVTQCIKDLSRFDRIVGFYSTKFDLPFVRTRAAICGVPFPEFGELKHTDIYYVVRNKFRLSSNRLENACRYLLGKTQKTRINPKFWRMAAKGDQPSLRYVLDHCEKDVIDLELLYNKVISYRKVSDLSI